MNSDLAQAQYTEGSEGAIQQHFNIETAKNLLLPVPPVAEQIAITSVLDTDLARLDATRARSAEMIARLRERRSALITAAVTGQIDVTGAHISEAAA
jgi:type I restriction enzyme S subunit